MSNNVENLFDSVLSKLPAEPANVRHAPNVDSDLSSDFLDEPPDADDNEVKTLDAHDFIYQGHDNLQQGRAPWPLGADVEERIEGGIRRSGFDVLAFYKSRRYLAERPFRGRWGIFYLRHGLLYLESQIAIAYPTFGDPRSLAHQFLRSHERFHFQADLQTLMFEAVKGQHLHEPLRNAFRGRRDSFVEEALANRQAWLWSQKSSVGIEEFAHDFMKLQPAAYARFDEPKLMLAAEWAANVVDGAVSSGATRDDLAQWVEAFPKSFLRPSLCPEYVVYPSAPERWLSPVLVLPKVTKIEDGEDVIKRLSSRYGHIKGAWERTKQKLVQAPLLHGLNFKPWPDEGHDCYSVRVDDKFRAHLRHKGNGVWTAYILGPHKELGHG